MVAHHRKAGYPALAALPVLDTREAPVHLVRLSGSGPEALAASALRRHMPPRRGHEVPVSRYVGLHAGEATPIPLAEQPFIDHLRVGDTPPELVVHKACVAGGHRRPGLPPTVAVWKRPEPMLPDRPRPRSSESRPATEFGQAERIDAEPFACLGGHLLKGLVYNLL